MGSRADSGDLKLIASYSGKVVIGFGSLNLIPLLTGIIAGEWAAVLDFSIGLGLSLSVGFSLAAFGSTNQKASWGHGMVSAATSWLIVMGLAAIPYALSGFYASYLDALFDAMSGFTTTGLTLINDLDHLSISMNMWRHLLTFVGGQGVVVLALAFLVSDPSGGYTLYVGEGKDERLLPNVGNTAKAIWKISLVYLCIGTCAMTIAGLLIGMRPGSAFLHGLWVFMAAWSTGGFAPMSQNLLYYHSALYELFSLAFFVLGSFNFALHHSVWSGNIRELRKNLETVTFAISLSLAVLIGCYSLLREGVYSDAVSLFRKGYYLLASGHTTTGFMTVYAKQFATEWGNVAVFVMILAMLIGGSACSTAGGLKALRLGLIAKALVREVRRLLQPANAIVQQRYWYHGQRVLDDGVIRNALLIAVLYAISFSLAIIAGLAAGYPFLESVFEAASVAGNVGLSIGVTTPAMPNFLKGVYIFIMWIGRLEFMAVLALFGYVVKAVRRRA